MELHGGPHDGELKAPERDLETGEWMPLAVFDTTDPQAVKCQGFYWPDDQARTAIWQPWQPA